MIRKLVTEKAEYNWKRARSLSKAEAERLAQLTFSGGGLRRRLKSRFRSGRKNDVVYLAKNKRSGRIVGWLHASVYLPWNDEAYVSSYIFVDRRHRNKGIGSELVGLFEKTIHTSIPRDTKNVSVEPTLAGRGFWESLGYKQKTRWGASWTKKFT
jgi:GNAT superfamily N-acetyltransferase